MPRRLLPAGVLIVLMLAGPLILPAKAEEKPVVSDVIIQGNRRTSTEQIKVRLHTQAGKEYDPAALDEDVREMYKTRQFSNIRTFVEPDGPGKVKVYLSVADLPNQVQKVTFLGANHLKPEELQKEIGVRPGTPLNPKLNEEGCQKILSKYKEQGRSFASCILVKGGQLGDTEVVYQITEGPKVKVRDIQFIGNTFVSGAQLATKIHSWQNWFHLLGGNYNSKMAEADTHELIKYFKKFGYQDVKVSLETQRSADGGEVTLIFHIQEGRRHTVKDIPQVINDQSIPHEQLEAMLLTKSGEFLDENKVNADKTRIKCYIGYTGRDVQVQDHYVWSSDAPGSEVQYVEEHPQARVSGVFIIGNDHTRDKVILRQVPLFPTGILSYPEVQQAEKNPVPPPTRIVTIRVTGNKRISSESILAHVPLSPGELLSYPDLKQAEKNLADLGLFVVDPTTGVHPTITVIDRDDSVHKDILITVKEKKAKATDGKSE